MRYRELLLEYRRDVTAQNLGKKLLLAFARTTPQLLTTDAYELMGISAETWSNLRLVANMVAKPNSYDEWIDLNKRINGQIVQVNTKTAPEILRANASQIINGLLAYFESKDPTPHKEYTQWIARSWANNHSRLEDINRNDLLGLHYIGKRRRMIRPEDADINRFKIYSEFERAMDKYDLDAIARSAQQLNRGNSRVVFDDDQMRIIVPEDVAAACYYGQGTRWCTAATRGTNYFERYNRTGPLYIILPKKPKHNGEKYQLHAESDQLMNEEDDQVSYTTLISRFPALREWLLKNVPKTNNYIELLPDDRLVNYWRTGLSVLQPAIDDALQRWVDDDLGYRQWQIDKAIERGYVDGNEEVDWERVYDDKDLNDYADYNESYESAVAYINSMKNYSADEIREHIADFVFKSDENYSPEIDMLDEVYEKIFDAIGLDDVGRISRRDLLIDPIERYVTNRKIISKETTDGYVFALSEPERRK